MWPSILDALGLSDITPVGQATGDLVTYILGYGVLGVVALALAFRFLVPAKALEEVRETARGDLVAENARLITRAEKAEAQRDEALKIAQTQLVPLLSQFTATTAALIPLLQELVYTREAGRARNTGR